MGDRLTTEVADVLAQVLEEGNVPRFTLKEGNEPKLNPAAERCYKHGWLHRMQILRQPGYEKDVYFSSSNLRYSSEGKILSTGAQPKPIEAQYQDEFYRCFNKIAGRGVTICSEWSRTTNGRVNFYIPDKGWAVEIVREQDRINEHIMRFRKNGKYYPWVESGLIDDWIIVNCTTSMPTYG
ncbi:uncharacterized protein NFIA_070440 [Aspergillus fischeri NRRL 181]|uniref:Uncharacterized protein n=1 Tax=Neosartorya fischeri (strain ATCC 1020 / DSM 3700 / CBS 544.65 / FGSC A1164 / JCM 1740 / NRRL 181 / WB 181) TaxID=331117 RepID=A1D829_NEOFI|nr:uncharacterized protein NFIA_070440 [Aspergillus fischeri NRRL 181]EAW21873.1 hypothetical protein NFIA_070440 [Aspergillus fischeri NRRL 181]